MGLARGHVSVQDYSAQWAQAFDTERARLAMTLGLLALAIEHVGSTSIVELCAKPLIDIAIDVAEMTHGERCIAPLSALGYEYKGDAGIAGRHFFAKGGPENRTHYVRVEPLDGTLWRDHILFRD